MKLSQDYSNVLSKLEGIRGTVSGNPGYFSWYYDNIGVATLGYGHALIDPAGNHIRRGESNASLRADAAVKALFPGGGGVAISAAQASWLKAKDMNAFAVDVAPLLHVGTPQAQFDALVDFAYNVGVGALKGSTLLRMHNSGGALGSADLQGLAFASRAHAPILSIGAAFAAWSNADHQWSKGVFHRRMFEFLIYSGTDYAQSYSTAFSFSD